MRRSILTAALAALAAAGAVGCDHAAPARAAASLPRCASGVTRFEGHFPRAAGGSPEVEAPWLAAHRCAVRVVDVREPDERRGPLGAIDVAEAVPLAEVERAAERWRRDEPLVLVCRSGRRSERAVEQLRALGFRRAASLTGGMLAWEARGFPVTRDAPTVPRAPARPAVAPAAVGDLGALRAAFARPGSIVWTRAAALLGASGASCIDGRAETPVLGTPGGDAGELVLSLSALEQELGRPLEAAWIASLFDRYVESFGRFYLHTDRHALGRLRAALRADPRFAGQTLADDDALLAFVRAPPPALEDAVLAWVERPEHVGCGHLRMMIEHPERYGVRAGLVGDVLRAAFTHGWRRPELLDLEVLDGEHEERGVLEVQLENPVHAHSVVPMVTPHEGTRGLFVVHPQVAAFLRAETAEFLAEQLAPEEARRVRLESLRARTAALGERQLRATVDALAPHLPHYVLRVSERAHAVTAVARD
jgi:rhodanese-related sulfurtransferase